MKRLLWVSVLLALAGVLMPALFLQSGAAEARPEAAVSPQSSESAYVPQKDAKISFTVADGESAQSVTMADYLPHAVAAEMPANFAPEALRAQAIAARTYILYCTTHQNPKHPQAAVCKNAGCCLAFADDAQLKKNWGESFETNMAAIREAVTATDGQVLVYDGTPILASFPSSSSGKTEDGEALWGAVPYLKSVSTPENEKDVPDFVTTVEVTPENFKETVLGYKADAQFGDDPAAWVGQATPDASGRVQSLPVGGLNLAGAEVRKLFSLRSTSFTLTYQDGKFVFTVRGYGHGLGMSQYGANAMAKSGFTCAEILAHYYPDTKLVSA